MTVLPPHADRPLEPSARQNPSAGPGRSAGVNRPHRSSGEFLQRGLSLPFLCRTALFVASAALLFSDFFRIALFGQQPFTSGLVVSIAVVVVANPLARWLLLLRMKRPPPCPPAPAWNSCVVTTFVPGSESIPMLAPMLAALVRLRHPHDTWLLDEGDEPEVRALCVRLGVSHFSRRHRPEYQAASGTFKARSKHGNYNAWLTEIGYERYDSLTAFDPDHLPQPEFLDEVLGYFADPSIGYVQAPQAYYNQSASVVAAGAAEETYDFNSTIQMASYGMGFPIVIGSHNSHRMTALRDVGGFAAHDADDLLITILYRSRGWQGVYVPRILARGITPVDWQGYLTQQRRWARSVLDLKFRPAAMLGGALPRLTRLMNALHGLNYLQPAFLLTAGMWLLLSALATGTVPAIAAAIPPAHVALLTGSIALCHFYRQQFFLDPVRESGIHWRTRLLRLAKAPFLLLAMKDVVLRRQQSYEITAKMAAAGGKPGRVLVTAFAPIAALIVAAWVAGASTNADYPLACHLWGGLSLALCAGLMVSDFLPVAAPFDARLIPSVH